MDILLLIFYFLIVLVLSFLFFARFLVAGNVFKVFTVKFWRSMTRQKFWLAILSLIVAGLVGEVVNMIGKFFVK